MSWAAPSNDNRLGQTVQGQEYKDMNAETQHNANTANPGVTRK